MAASCQTTQLLWGEGRLYDIGSANPLLTYKVWSIQHSTQNYDKWGVQAIVTTPGWVTTNPGMWTEHRREAFSSPRPHGALARCWGRQPTEFGTFR